MAKVLYHASNNPDERRYTIAGLTSRQFYSLQLVLNHAMRHLGSVDDFTFGDEERCKTMIRDIREIQDSCKSNLIEV